MRREQGFTLIEMMVVVVVIAVVLVVVVPSFRDLIERRRVEGAANGLVADLQYARSEAVSRQANVVLATTAGGTGYTITTGATTLKTATLPSGVTVTGGVTRTYEALRGTVQEGDASIGIASSNTAGQLRVVGNFMGRVQLCSPSGSLTGYASC